MSSSSTSTTGDATVEIAEETSKDNNTLRASFSLQECAFYVTIVFFCFILYNNAVKYAMRTYLPKLAATEGSHSYWRIKNVFISWTHALIASYFVTQNVLKNPSIFDDMINVSTKLAYISISVSIGYFLYDTWDILSSNKKLTTQSYEVLVHHTLILFIFFIPVSINLFVGYTICAMSIEYNTIFLHLRFMIAFNPENRKTLTFRIASIVNIVTFVVFRILTLCWMTRWILLNRKLISVGWFYTGSVGLAIMMVINILLLQRLIQADFSIKTSSPATTSKQQKENQEKSK